MRNAVLQLLALKTRRAVGHTLCRIRSAPYVRKWLLLGTIIGVVAGVGAVVFYDGLRLGTHFLLTDIGGFRPAGTLGEGGATAASGFSRPWAIPLVVGGGGLLAGLLVFRLAPEAEGHGTDAAIHAVHTNPKGVRPRVVLVKLVASVLTIGSGGSGGREGPTAQISSGFGSVFARALNLTPTDSRICVSAGIASGIGAIFRAPLGGALLGAELLYRDDVEIDALIPSLVASVVAYAIFGGVLGNFSPIFGYQSGYQITHVWGLALFVLVGAVSGLMGRLYTGVFYRLTERFKALPVPAAFKPAVAGLAVGGIGLLIPGVLGTGYGQVQSELDIHHLLSMPLWIVLLVPIGKIVATGLSIGSGGSGGIFGPGMVIGGATGAALWRLLHFAGLGPHDQAAFVIVGMISCFGAIAHAPLAVMIMVAEMTGSLAMLPPAMIAIGFAVLVVGHTTIYRSQLPRRADSPAHRFSFGLPASSTIPITRVMQPPRLVLTSATKTGEALRQLDDASLPGAPVVNPDGAYLGTVQSRVLVQQMTSGESRTIGKLADPEAMILPTDAGLDAAIEAVTGSHDGWVPVLDDDMHVAGVVAVGDFVHAWRHNMIQSIRRLTGATESTVVVDTTVEAGSAADGALIRDLKLPKGAVIVSLERSGTLIFPEADEELHSGDTVTAMVRASSENLLRDLLGSDHPKPPLNNRGDGRTRTVPVDSAPRLRSV